VNISSYAERKRKALESHRSQVEKFAQSRVKWVDGIMARARFRGFESQVDYAEVFFVYRMTV